MGTEREQRENYRGEEIHVYNPAQSWKFVAAINGHVLVSPNTNKPRVFTTAPGALSAARRAIRNVLRLTSADPVLGPPLDFKPESFVAHSRHGKYVIAVTYKGRPIGGRQGTKRHARTEFLAYFHAATGVAGAPSCTFLSPEKATLGEAVQRCRDHARDLERAGAPTTPEVDA